VNKKRSPVPVFLLYAGIIHAIGLALLLPMIVTLPRPGEEAASKSAAIDVDIAPAAPTTANIPPADEHTSALPAAGQSLDEQASKQAPEPEYDGPVANVSPAVPPAGGDAETPKEVEPEAEAPSQAPKAKAKPKTETAKPAKAKTAAPIKQSAARRHAAKPSVRRSAKAKAKPIAPFNGALTGLFAPGAPATRR
jgi:hypothetical protein